MNGVPVVGICDTPFKGTHELVKRASDVVLSLLILTLISPLLLAIAVGCEDAVRGLGPPWPLHRAEMDLFVAAGLFEDHFETLDARRRDTFPKYRALYRRPAN